MEEFRSRREATGGESSLLEESGADAVVAGIQRLERARIAEPPKPSWSTSRPSAARSPSPGSRCWCSRACAGRSGGGVILRPLAPAWLVVLAALLLLAVVAWLVVRHPASAAGGCCAG